jgi:hypothetical protein
MSLQTTYQDFLKRKCESNMDSWKIAELLVICKELDIKIPYDYDYNNNNKYDLCDLIDKKIQDMINDYKLIKMQIEKNINHINTIKDDPMMGILYEASLLDLNEKVSLKKTLKDKKYYINKILKYISK